LRVRGSYSANCNYEIGTADALVTSFSHCLRPPDSASSKGLELNWCHLAQRTLTATSVIGPFNPVTIARRNSSLVSHLWLFNTFFLQEREERFHGCVVAGGADSPHRADQAVVLQGADVGVGTKLRSAVGVHDGVVSAPLMDGVMKCSHRQ